MQRQTKVVVVFSRAEAALAEVLRQSLEYAEDTLVIVEMDGDQSFYAQLFSSEEERLEEEEGEELSNVCGSIVTEQVTIEQDQILFIRSMDWSFPSNGVFYKQWDPVLSYGRRLQIAHEVLRTLGELCCVGDEQLVKIELMTWP